MLNILSPVEAHEKYKEILNGIGEWAKNIRGAKTI